MVEVVIWSLAAALGTSIGGLLIYLIKSENKLVLIVACGFAGGIMLGATCFGLLPAALSSSSTLIVILFLLVGAVFVWGLDQLLPHLHGGHIDHTGWEEHHQKPSLPRKTYMLAAALTIHNIPEGMAVGAAFAYGSADLGVALAIAIAVHNIPEGFAVVAPGIGQANTKARLAKLAALTGLVEIPAIIGAYMLASSVSFILSPALAFAGGAMLYVVFDELLPDTFSEQRTDLVAGAIISGVIVFMFVQSLAS
jgi:ZIP family zinc transporter